VATQESTLRVGVDSKPMVDGAKRGEKALGALGAKGTQLGKTFDSLNSKTALLAKAFTALMAVGVGAFFTAAIRAAGSFETKLAEISTLVDSATFKMETLTGALKEQSAEFGSTAVQQGAAAYQIISAGAGTATDAINLLTASNKLAVGGVTDVATAADGLTSLLNAYGLASSNAAAVSDALFVGMRAGKTTIGELSSSLGKVAPLAAQAGVGVDELVAAVAALTKGGISTREAVTGVRAIMAAVVKPTSEAAEVAEKLGIQFDSAGLKSRGLAGFMEDLVSKTGGSTDAMAKLFGGIEALIPALALAGQAGVDMSSIMEDMAAKSGATQEAFEKMTNTFEFQSAVLRGNLANVFLTIGAIINSVLAPALKFLNENFEAITRFVAVAAAGFTALLIPAMISMVPVIASVTTGLLAMAAAWLRTPFGAIQAIIMAAAGALAYFGDKNVEVVGRVATVWQVFKAVLMTVAQVFGYIYNAGIAAWTGIAKGLSGLATGAHKIFLQVWNWATAAWTGAKSAAGGFFDSVTEWLDGFLANWDLSLDTIGGWIRSSVNAYIGIYVGFVSAISPVITRGIPVLFELAMAKAKNIAIQGLQNIINVFVRGLGGLGDALDLIPGFDGVGDAIRESLTVDFSDLRKDTAQLESDLAAVGSRIKTSFGAALSIDYVGGFGEVIREGAETVRNEFDGSIFNPFNDALIRSAATLRNDFGANLDMVIESEEIAATIQEELNRAISDGAPAITDFGDAAGGAAGQLSELNVQQQEFIDGLAEQYAKIVESSGGARESVRLWYAEQLQTLQTLGLAYEDYATMIETIFNERMGEARRRDLENATDWASGISRALDSIGEDVGSTADMAESAFKNAFDKSSEALADFVMTGKLDFGELARSIIADIIKMQARMLLFNAMKMVFPGFSEGGMVPAFASGGQIRGPGTGRSDSILARVSNGEYIVNAKATREFLPVLNQINSGEMPTLADGGLAVGSLAPSRRASTGRQDAQRDGSTTVIFNITTPDAASFKQSEAQIANRMRRMVQRGARGE